MGHTKEGTDTGSHKGGERPRSRSGNEPGERLDAGVYETHPLALCLVKAAKGQRPAWVCWGALQSGLQRPGSLRCDSHPVMCPR